MKHAIIAAGIAGPASAVAAGASKPAVGLLSGLVGQILGGTVAVAVGAGAVWGVRETQKWSKADQPSRAQLVVAQAPTQELVLPPPVREVDAPVIVQPAVKENVGAPERRAAPVRVAKRSEGTPELPLTVVETDVPSIARSNVPPPPPPPVAYESSFREEIELLRQAVVQRDASHWAATIETLNRYDAKFPAGSLRIEALSLRADALCALNRRDEARSIAGQLDNTAKRRRQDFCSNE